MWKLVFVAAILTICISCHEQDNMPFSKGKWATGDQRLRGRMVDSIIADSLLIGKTRREVLELLGDPTGSDSDDQRIVYLVDIGEKIGPLGAGGTWPFYLTIDIDTATDGVREVWCRD